MEATVTAVFHNGVFVPTTACDLPENTEVQVLLQPGAMFAPRERESKIINIGRGPQIAGSRITVYDVMDYLKHNWHRDRIAMLFRLSSRDIQVAIDYIEAHRERLRSSTNESSTATITTVIPPRCRRSWTLVTRSSLRLSSSYGAGKRKKVAAMPRILADHNIEGHVRALVRILLFAGLGRCLGRVVMSTRYFRWPRAAA